MPVTSTASSTNAQVTSSGKREPTAKQTAGASEVVGSPVGWAAVGDQEPDFDETILFSDEDENRPALKETTSPNRPPSLTEGSGSSTPSFGKPMGSFTIQSSSKPDVVPNQPSNFGPLSPMCYRENAARTIPDVWSTVEESHQFHPLGGNQSLTRHALAQPVEACAIGINSQYAPRSVPQSFTDAYFTTNPLSNRPTSHLSHQIPDAIFTADAESDMQNVQRQVRTQQFKSAVEKAQQARLARQKQEIYSPESELVHRSLVGLLSEPDDPKVLIPQLPTAPSHASTAFSASAFPQLMLSSVYQQAASPNRPDLVAAVAAAKAVAMACNETTNTAIRPGDAALPQPNIHTSVSGAWHDHFPVSPSAAATAVYSGRSSTVPIPPAAPPHIPTGAPANAVLLNPQHFVERFLQLLNQQQVVKPTLEPVSLLSKDTVQTTDTRQSHSPETSRTAVNENAIGTSFPEPDVASHSKVDELASKLGSMKSDSPKTAQVVPSQTMIDSNAGPSAETEGSRPLSKKEESKRVPGLMDVKVSTASRHFSLLWDQDDSSSNRPRNRAKFSSDRGKQFSKNKRQLHRFQNDYYKTSKERNQDTADTVNSSFDNDFGGSHTHSSAHTRTWQLSKEARAKSSKAFTDSAELLNKGDLEPDVECKTQAINPDEGDALSDVSEEECGSQSVSKGRLGRSYPSGRQTFVYSKTRDDGNDAGVGYSERSDYHHQGGYSRRSRGSHYASASRPYADEDASATRTRFDSRYQGSFRGTRSRVSDANPSYENEDYEDYRPRDAQLTSSRSTQRGYTRGYRHPTGSSHTYYRSHTSSQEPRRRMAYLSAKAYTRAADYNYDDDDDHHHSGDVVGDRDSKAVPSRKRTTEAPVKNRSRGPKNTTENTDKECLDDQRAIETPADQPSKKNLNEETVLDSGLLSQLDDSDVPTVRVPASDVAYTSRLSHYRTGTNDGSRPTGSRRSSARMGSLQQGGKRPAVNTLRTSRRYRDMRNNYREDKDDDGGAAGAGGAGRSNAIGTSCGSNGLGAQTSSGGHINSGGGRSGGNNHDANAYDTDLPASIAEQPDTNGNDTNHNNSIALASSDEPKARPNYSMGDFPCPEPKARFSRSQTMYNRSCTYSQQTSFHHGRQRGTRRMINGGEPTRPMNLSEIPPLMSIKPVGPFYRHSVDFDSCDPKQTTTEDNTVLTGASNDEREVSVVESGNTDSPTDGFTEVVSKANKKLARRRRIFQHAESNSSSHPLESRKDIADVSKPDVSKDSGKQLIGDPSHRRTFVKPKSTHPKPTFMGPPLPTVNSLKGTRTTIADSSSASATTLTSTTTTTVAWPVTSSASSNSVSPITQSATRTWSKVVGTKSALSVTSQPDPSTTTQTDLPSYTSELECDKPISDTKLSSSSATALANEVMSTQHAWSNSATASEQTGPLESHPNCTVSTTGGGGGGPTNASPSSTTAITSSAAVVSNNICKVRPQQQQSSLLPSNTIVSAPTMVQLNPTDSVPTSSICSSEAMRDHERLDAVYEGNVELNSHPLKKDHSHTLDNTLSLGSDILSSHIPSAYGANRLGMQHTNSSVETHLASSFWQPADPMGDPQIARLATSNIALPPAQMPTSDVLANLFTGSTGHYPLDNTGKTPQSLTLFPRNQAYNMPPYGNAAASSVDLQGCGLYARSVDESSKGSAPAIPHSHNVFTTVCGGPVYMSPPQQQQSTGQQLSQPSHPFPATWTMQQNQHPHLSQQLIHPQRYRQRVAHQLEQPTFGNYPYQSKVQNEYGLIPSINACVQPGSAGGLYSTVQGPCQSNFHPTATRSAVPSAGNPNPWSAVTPSMLTPNQEYNNVAFGSAPSLGNTENGLLPHPMSQNGYNSNHGSMPLSSSPTPNLLAHPNFVSLVGHERAGTDPSHASIRQRMYSSHTLSRSPNAQGHQPLQVHSAFYPSHQRLHLQQIPGSHGRAALPGLINSHNGLYATAFGAQSGNQPVTPPIPAQVIGPAKILSPLFHPATWGP